MLDAALAALAVAVSAGEAVPAPVRAAVEGALAVRGARAEVVQVRGAVPPGCAIARAELPRAVEASGDVPLRVAGAGEGGEPCEAWVWARVRVTAPALVTTRAVAAGDALEGATAPADREVLPGRPLVAALPPGAAADRALAAGTALAPEHLRVGPKPGEPVRVVLRTAGIEIAQDGRAASCRRGRACALLPSGRRVEGSFLDGVLVIDGR
jgi:hypothetical protein